MKTLHTWSNDTYNILCYNFPQDIAYYNTKYPIDHLTDLKMI